MDIYKIWKPVLDALKVTDETKRKFMAEYGTKHREIQRIQEENLPRVPEGWIPPEDAVGGDLDNNLLPISIKALNMIKFDGKNIQLKDNLPSQTFCLKFDSDWFKEYRERTGNDWFQKVEAILINYLTDTINFNLREKNNLYVDIMIHSIDVKEDGMYLYSKYEVD